MCLIFALPVARYQLQNHHRKRASTFEPFAFIHPACLRRWTRETQTCVYQRPLGSMRTQLGGFLAGFAMAGSIAMYQLQKDVWSSHRLLLQQVRP